MDRTIDSRETRDLLNISRQAADASTDGLAVVDREYRFRYVNPALARRLDLDPADAIDKTLPGLFGAETFQSVIKAQMDRCLAGEAVTFGAWLDYPDGGLRYVRAAYSPLRDDGGRIVGVVISSRDETDQQRATERERHITDVIRAIRNVNQLIAQGDDPARLIAKSCELLIETRGYFSAWIALTDGETVPLAATAGLDDAVGFRRRLDGGWLPSCADWAGEADRGIVIVEDTASRCGDCPLATLYEDAAALVTALRHQGRCWGVLAVSMPKWLARDAEEHALFAEVAIDIALALSKIESEQRQHRQAMILDAIGDEVTVTDLDGRIIYVNKAAIDASGVPRESLIGRPVDVLGDDPAHAARQRAIFEHTLATGEWQGKTARRSGDGHDVVLDVRTWLIRDEQGVGRYLGGVARDVTEREAIERALTESRDLYSALVELAPVGIMVHQDERLVFVNRYYAGMLGAREPSELIGRSIWDTVAESEKPKIRELVAQRLRTRKAVPVETRHVRLDGSEIDVRVIGLPVVFAGRPATQVICEDIRETKRLEDRLRQAQKMEAVGQLTGGIAHDFNNLLHVILTNIELAQFDGTDILTARMLLREAVEAGHRGARLTQQLLAFSRKQTLRPREIDINALVDHTLSLLERTLGEDIRIETALDPAAARVTVDEAGLQNAILNLALNARAAMPNGGVLRIATGIRERTDPTPLDDDILPPGRFVEVAIADTGSGMSETVLKRAFEPFFTTREVGEGSGLGLSMVYGFARQSGGFATLESALGVGTTVRIMLPFAAGTAECDASSPTSSGVVARTMRVLLVEDDADVRRSTAMLLRSCGCEVLEAENATPALQRLGADSGIDLLVTDVVLTGTMNGVQLARQAVVVRPEVKVVLVSGYPKDSLEKAGLTGDRFGFLGKPFSKDDLFAVLDSVHADGADGG